MMKMPSTAELQEWTRALTSPKWEAADSSSCPDPMEVWEAASGQLGPEATAEIAEHAAQCAICAHDLQAARQSVEELGEKRPLPPWWKALPESASVLLHRFFRLIEFNLGGARRPATALTGAGRASDCKIEKEGSLTWPSRSFVAVGAALILCLSLIVGQLQPPTDWTRTTTHRGLLQSTSEPGKDLALSREDFVLQWEAVAGAFYNVRLLNQQDFELVASVKGLREPRLTIPSSDLVDLPDGTLLLCHIETRHDSGAKSSSKFNILLSESPEAIDRPDK